MALTLTGELRDRFGGLLASLNHLSLEFQDVFVDEGTGTLTIPGDDPAVAMMIPGTEVWCYLDGILAFSWEIETLPSVVTVAEGEESARIASIDGPGRPAVLTRSAVEPVKGLDDALAPQHRLFSFASIDFPSAGGWAPAAVGNRQDFVDPQRHQTVEWITEASQPEEVDAHEWIDVASPNGWEVPYAYWIWGTADTTIVGKCYFRATMTVAGSTTLRIAVTGDNLYTLFLDGAPVIGENVSEAGWQQHKPLEITLPAGVYQLAAVVENIEWAYGVNPAGLLFACYPLDSNGEPILDENGDVVSVRVSDGTWTVSAYPATTPGWTPGEIVLKLIAEAQARGELGGFTVDFTTTTDSAGNPWAGAEGGGSYIPSFGVPIGATMLDVLSELVEQGWVDWRMKPGGRVLQMFNQAPTGWLSAAEYQITGDAVTQKVMAQEFVAQERPTNRLLVKWTDGYFRADDTFSQGVYGIFGEMVSIDTPDKVEAQRQARVIFANIAIPRRSHVLRINPAGGGDIPYLSFAPGDMVTAPDEAGVATAYRVLSISVSHDDLGYAIMVLELDTRLNARQRRRISLLETLGSGVAGNAVVRNTLTATNGILR